MEMDEAPPLKVLLTNVYGEFLAIEDGRWVFTDERTHGVVFDYVADRVPQQIEMAQQMYRLVLKAVPLDPGEFFEFCDGCNRISIPLDFFFDGIQFLCPNCRQRAK